MIISPKNICTVYTFPYLLLICILSHLATYFILHGSLEAGQHGRVVRES